MSPLQQPPPTIGPNSTCVYPAPIFQNTALPTALQLYFIFLPYKPVLFNAVLHPLLLQELHLPIKMGLEELDMRISKANKVMCQDNSGSLWADREALTTKVTLIFSWINILFFLTNIKIFRLKQSILVLSPPPPDPQDLKAQADFRFFLQLSMTLNSPFSCLHVPSVLGLQA